MVIDAAIYRESVKKNLLVLYLYFKNDQNLYVYKMCKKTYSVQNVANRDSHIHGSL